RVSRTWTTVAAGAALVGTSEIIFNYVVRDDRADRRRTRQVVGQFLPSVLAGAIITASLVHLSAALVPLLPGLWAICFGLGAFASRPYLPRATGWVALFYYIVGIALLWSARGPETVSGGRRGPAGGERMGRAVLLHRGDRAALDRARPGAGERMVGRRHVRHGTAAR